MDISKFDVSTARIITANLYIARRLNIMPTKMVKFILCNREYFPDITDEMIEMLKKEKNITEEELIAEQEVHFAEIHSEDKFEKELLEKAAKIDKVRREERAKRDYGKGIKSRKESDIPTNVYEGFTKMDI